MEDNEVMKKIRFNRRLLFYILIAVLFVLTTWTIWGNTALMVSTTTISSSRIPASFSGFRIAQVSDLHNAEFEENNGRLLELLSKTEPDIIVITGDLVDAQHTNITTALDFAKEVVRIAPAYYVTGNHEASLSQYSTLKAGLEAAGVVVLEDEAIQLERKSEAIQSIFIPFTSKCRGLFSLHVSGSLIHIAIHQGLGFLDTAFFGLRFQHGNHFLCHFSASSDACSGDIPSGA